MAIQEAQGCVVYQKSNRNGPLEMQNVVFKLDMMEVWSMVHTLFPNLPRTPREMVCAAQFRVAAISRVLIMTQLNSPTSSFV